MHGFPRVAPLLLPGLMALAAAHAVAAPPDAGQILQEPRAPLAPPASASPALKIERPTGAIVPEGGPTVRLARLRFQGNAAFSDTELQQLLADAPGRDLSFADLSRLAERVTRRYREAGYMVARAYLPAQELENGVLEIAVLEGKLGQVEVNNGAGLRGAALTPLIQLPLDLPVQTASLDQVLLTLADLPGVTVQATLRPGQALGASDLLLEVRPERRIEGSADIDNFGSVYTGEYRAGATLYWNNPLDRGDQLSLRVQASNDHLRYARVGYQLPLGSRATRMGVALSDMDYRLGKDFSVLDATGNSQVASLYLRQSLLRSIPANWHGQVQFDIKRLSDEVGRTSTPTRQYLRNLVLGLNGDWRDNLAGGARNALFANITVGALSLDAASAGLDAAGARSAGNFLKLETQWQRVQFLREGLTLALSLRGQLTDRNLASAEKMSLGGSQGVRAYAQGEALGDRGWQATAELRWNLAPGWQVQAFGDAGGVKTSAQPREAGSNHRRLAGAGVGAGWASGRYQVNATAAWATDRESPRPQPDRQPRLWVQASLGF
jgi:hemolysin activation/secretion protein